MNGKKSFDSASSKLDLESAVLNMRARVSVNVNVRMNVHQERFAGMK